MDEGGQRANHKGCVVFDNKNKDKLKSFKPLNPVTDKWEEDFIKVNKIKLCKLYCAPYYFKRTGCKGCPFSLDLYKQLLQMKKLLPSEYLQWCTIWKPIYDEYVKLGYRLPKDFYEQEAQFTIDDYKEETK